MYVARKHSFWKKQTSVQVAFMTPTARQSAMENASASTTVAPQVNITVHVASVGGGQVQRTEKVNGGLGRDRASSAPPTFPPIPSSTGKRYYSFVRSSPPFVAAGQPVALRELGGSWIGAGVVPRGFAGLEEAIQHLVERRPGTTECVVRW